MHDGCPFKRTYIKYTSQVINKYGLNPISGSLSFWYLSFVKCCNLPFSIGYWFSVSWSVCKRFAHTRVNYWWSFICFFSVCPKKNRKIIIKISLCYRPELCRRVANKKRQMFCKLMPLNPFPFDLQTLWRNMDGQSTHLRTWQFISQLIVNAQLKI